MTDSRGVLFVPYQDTLALLSVEDALRICEDVYGMHARGSVVWSSPASFKLDVADGFNNHWHVKSVLLKDIPTTGVRLYNYYDDGTRKGRNLPRHEAWLSTLRCPRSGCQYCGSTATYAPSPSEC